MGSKDQFEKYALSAERLLNNVSKEDKVILYGLYKQATIGDVNTSRPSIFKSWDRALWDAWKAVEGKPQYRARVDYVTKVNELVDAPSRSILLRLWAPHIPVDGPSAHEDGPSELTGRYRDKWDRINP